jgi:hypothetical protein
MKKILIQWCILLLIELFPPPKKALVVEINDSRIYDFLSFDYFLSDFDMQTGAIFKTSAIVHAKEKMNVYIATH